MPTNSPRASSREKLLDAAADLITQHSVQELTLEGVAQAAGVTKGGLIYHFKTKDELLGAVVERILSQLDERYRAKAATRGNTTDALLLALVDDTFDMPESERRLVANLLAAASSYPHLLAPVQGLYGRLYGQFADAGKNAGLALVLAAALDGIVLLELMNLHQFQPEQHQAMRQVLQELAKNLA